MTKKIQWLCLNNRELICTKCLKSIRSGELYYREVHCSSTFPPLVTNMHKKCKIEENSDKFLVEGTLTEAERE